LIGRPAIKGRRVFVDRARLPRSFGAILDDVFRQYREHWRPLFTVSLVFLAPFAILSAILGFYVQPPAAAIQTVDGGSIAHILTQALNAGILRQELVYAAAQTLLGLLSACVVSPLAGGSFYLMADDVAESGRLRGAVFSYVRRAAGRWGACLSTFWLLAGLVAAGIALFTFVFLALTFAARAVAFAQPFVLLLLGILYMAFLYTAIWISVRLVFVFCAVIVGKLHNWGALRYSWNLVSGSWWRIVWTLGLTAVALWFANFGVYSLLSAVIPGAIAAALFAGLVDAFLSPLLNLVTLHLYRDLALRKSMGMS
jgi:hypothetical protein